MPASDAGRSPGASQPMTPQSLEWPTILLAVTIYGGWLAATVWHDRAPTLALAAIGGWLVAWHGSLQHEAIHGHPTPWRWVNTALVVAPLSLWLPYEIYRRSHLEHHATEHLAHPAHDPEARYLAPGGGKLRDRLARAIARLQSTLAARLVLGPAIEVSRFLTAEAVRVARGDGAARREWALHGLLAGAIVAWLHVVRMPITQYLALFVYPGIALSLIRSFAEHRAGPAPGGQVAVVEKAPLLGLLFLNNNLHAAHHAWPGLAWWRLPARYRRHREALLASNGGLLYAGYADVFRRFLLRPHDVIIHPHLDAPAETRA